MFICRLMPLPSAQQSLPAGFVVLMSSPSKLAASVEVGASVPADSRSLSTEICPWNRRPLHFEGIRPNCDTFD